MTRCGINTGFGKIYMLFCNFNTLEINLFEEDMTK